MSLIEEIRIKERIRHLEQENQHQKLVIAKLKHQLFGSKSEKVESTEIDQLLFNELEAEAAKATDNELEAQMNILVPNATELNDPRGHEPWLPDERRHRSTQHEPGEAGPRGSLPRHDVTCGSQTGAGVTPRFPLEWHGRVPRSHEGASQPPL